MSAGAKPCSDSLIQWVVPIAPIDRNLNRYVWSRHGNGSTKVGGDPLEKCRANGVGAITELKIGYGGIVKGACTALLN
jgi:hypothetical protein